MGVAVVDSLGGLAPIDAALLLHRRWGVGKRARDNGIVLLWSPALRKIAVSVGYGLEGVLPDGRVGRIEDESMLPAFKRNAFDAAMVAGVRALAAAAREETHWRDQAGVAPGRPTESEPSPTAKPVPIVNRPVSSSSVPIVPIVLLGLAAIGVPLGLVYARRRPRQCPRGHGGMRRLGESEDDQALSAPELLEERLGSVDYDVWVCDQCDARITIPHARWFSAYSECPSCKRRTLETGTRTLVAATTFSEGLQVTTRRCKNCNFSDETQSVIPRIPPPVVSSNSGGSSGGGAVAAVAMVGAARASAGARPAAAERSAATERALAHRRTDSSSRDTSTRTVRVHQIPENSARTTHNGKRLPAICWLNIVSNVASVPAVSS